MAEANRYLGFSLSSETGEFIRPEASSSALTKTGGDFVSEVQKFLTRLKAIAHDKKDKDDLALSLLTIAKSKNPNRFFRELLALGDQAAQSEDLATASLIFQSLAEGPDFFGREIPPSIRSSSQKKWDSLQGKGGVAESAASFIRNLPKDVFHWGNLGGMLVAGPVFNRLYFRGLSRLATQTRSFWTRGIVAEGRAAIKPFAAEVASFWGVQRIYNQIHHPDLIKNDPRSIMGELAYLAATLGPLKLGIKGSLAGYDRAIGFNSLLRPVTSLPRIHQVFRPAVQQLGAYGGVISGTSYAHGQEWSPEHAPENIWSAGAATLIHLHFMGLGMIYLAGRRYGDWMQDTQRAIHEIKSRNLYDPNPPEWRPPSQIFNDLLPVRIAKTPDGIPILVRSEGEENNFYTQGHDGGRDSSVPPPLPQKSGVRISEWPQGRKVFRIRFADQPPLEPERSIFYRDALPILMDPKESNSRRNSIGAQLYDIRTDVEVYLRERFALEMKQLQSSDPELTLRETRAKEKENEEKIEAIQHQIRVRDFAYLHYRLFQWVHRFEYSRRELQKAADSAPSESQDRLRNLASSVALKHYAATRVQFTARQKILTEEKNEAARKEIADLQNIVKDANPGARQKILARQRALQENSFAASVFSSKSYPRLKKEFEDYERSFVDYIRSDSQLSQIFARYSDPKIPPFHEISNPENLNDILANTDFPKDVITTLTRNARHDPNLGMGSVLPLTWVAQVLVTEARDQETCGKIRAPIESYVLRLRDLSPWIHPRDLRLFKNEFEKLDQEVFTPRQVLLHGLTRLAQDRSENTPADLKNKIEDFLDATIELRKKLSPYQKSRDALPTKNWEEAFAHLKEFEARGIISAKTVAGLEEWYLAQEDSPNYQYRTESLIGLMDFLFEVIKTSTERQKVLSLIDQVLERKDKGMLDWLILRFYHFHYDLHKDDGFATRKGPLHSKDGGILDPQQRLRYALLKTALFYEHHPNFQGPYLELAEKYLEGKTSRNAKLAAPVNQRIKEFLEWGFDVQLVNRGSLGEAVLLLKRPESGESIVTVTSIQDPLKNPQSLHHWLQRASNLANAPVNGLPAGIHKSISIAIPSIQPGLSRQALMRWARDFLEGVEGIREIHLFVPKKGVEVTDPFEPNAYTQVPVTRDDHSTQKNIENLELELRADPKNLELRKKLIAAYKQGETHGVISDSRWALIRETAELFPEKRIARLLLEEGIAAQYRKMSLRGETRLKGFSPDDFDRSTLNSRRPFVLGEDEHFDRVAELFQLVLGPNYSLHPKKFVDYLDLGSVGFTISEIAFDRPRDGQITLQCQIKPLPNRELRPQILDSFLRNQEVNGMVGRDSGGFTLTLLPDPKGKGLALQFGSFYLPRDFQLHGIGTHLFGQVIALGRAMGVERIYTDIRYPQEEWGVDFKDERARLLAANDFRKFALSYSDEAGIRGFNLRVAKKVKPQTPQEIAGYHLDPVKRKLDLKPWNVPTKTQTKEGKRVLANPTFLLPEYQIGRVYLNSHWGPWEGVFDIRPGSKNMEIFANYYQKRLGRIFKIASGE